MTGEECAIWERLAAEQPIPDVMASPLGWDVWQRVQPDPDSRIAIARRDGAPVAMIALAPAPAASWKGLFSRRLVSAGDLHWQCRYPITGREVLAGTRALLEQLARDGGWDELVLGPMLADTAVCRAVMAAGHALGMRPLVSDGGRAPRILVRGTWAEYYASRSGKLRADVKHGEKRLAALGPVTLEEVRGGPGLDAALDAFFQVEATGWKLEEKTAIACDDGLRARYVTLAREASARGRFRTFVLRAGERVIAANYCIEHERELFQLKTGYDAAYAKAGPGNVLHKRVLEALWAGGACKSLDFMTGGGEHSAYKERWANDVRPYVEVRLYRPRRPRGQLLAHLTRLKRALDEREASRRPAASEP